MTTPRRALILIDVQQQYFEGPLEIQHPPHTVSLPNITAAIEAANAAGLPVAVFQHTAGEGAPVFDPTTPQFELRPEVEQRLQPGVFRAEKQFGTVFAGTGLVDWLRDGDIDTITLVGYMTNNCVLASAAEAETHGLSVEILSDATGAINITNEAGSTDARTVHTTLLALLNSNWAAVADTARWTDAVRSGAALEKSNLVVSALQGAAAVTAG